MSEQQNPKLYWSMLEHNDWTFLLAATSNGLCYTGSLHAPFEEFAQWAAKRFPQSVLVEDDEKLAPYRSEFIEFIEGQQTVLTMPLDFRGTAFQQSVWKALQSIAYGETVSYSDIAEQIGRPKAVRAVGAAIGANPVLCAVPCHRVLGKDGSLTGFRGGLEMKKQLLALEQQTTARQQ